MVNKHSAFEVGLEYICYNLNMQVKKDEKRLRIIESAISLLSEKNFEEVTTELIANRAKVGKGTLYTYFKSKDDLLGETLLYVLSEFLNATVKVKRCKCDLDRKIEMLFELYQEIAKSRENLLPLFMRIYIDETVNKRRSNIQNRMRNHLIKIFKEFESQLITPVDVAVDFIIVNTMPFSMKRFAQDSNYWKNVVEIIKKGIKKN
jgi:AcrR family transcriptional regulator